MGLVPAVFLTPNLSLIDRVRSTFKLIDNFIPKEDLVKNNPESDQPITNQSQNTDTSFIEKYHGLTMVCIFLI